MTDRPERQLTSGDFKQPPSELYLDAYGVKSTSGGLPDNTDFRNASKPLNTDTSGRDARGDRLLADSGNDKESRPWVLYDFGGPAKTPSNQADRHSKNKPSELKGPSHDGKLVDPGKPKEQVPPVQLRPADRVRPIEQTRPKEQIRPTDRRTEANRPEVRLRPGERIQDAINRAPEGSTVIVPPGVYNERLNITRDNITLKAYGKAVLDLQNRPRSAPAINISDRKNVTIDGFEIRNVKGGDTPTAIRVDGSSENIKIINNDIHHVESSSNAHGIGVFGTRARPLRNVTVANNKLHDLQLGASEALVINGNVDGFRITDNSIYNSNNIGIDIIGGEGVGKAGIDQARNGLIARNHINKVDAALNPKYRDSRGKPDPCAAGIYVDGGKNVTIEDNTVLNSNYGIELASERHEWNTEGITVRRNRISGSLLAGISLGGGSAGNGGVTYSVIENNDLRGNSRPIWRQNNIGSVTIRNNRTW